MMAGHVHILYPPFREGNTKLTFTSKIPLTSATTTRHMTGTKLKPDADLFQMTHSECTVTAVFLQYHVVLLN